MHRCKETKARQSGGAIVYISVSMALESVVGKSPLHWYTREVWQLSSLSLTYLVSSGTHSADQTKLGGWTARWTTDWLPRLQTRTIRFVARGANHDTTKVLDSCKSVKWAHYKVHLPVLTHQSYMTTSNRVGIIPEKGMNHCCGWDFSFNGLSINISLWS